MSAKRAKAKEWKKKNQQKKFVKWLIVGAICLAVLAGVGWGVWDWHSRSYVLIFEGQRISTTDLQLNMRHLEYMQMMGMAPMEINVVAQAMDHLLNFLVLEQAARNHGVGMDADEFEFAYETGVQMRQMFDFINDINEDPRMRIPFPNISDERMAQLMGTEFLFEKLMDVYVPTVEIDEEAFAVAFLDQVGFNPSIFVDMEFRIIEALEWETAYQAYNELSAADPADFDEIILRYQYERWGMEMDEPPSISLDVFRAEGTPMSTLNLLSSFEVGEITEPIDFGGEYIVFIVDEKVHVPAEEIEASFREQYEWNQQIQEFSMIVWQWRDAATYEFNERAIMRA